MLMLVTFGGKVAYVRNAKCPNGYSKTILDAFNSYPALSVCERLSPLIGILPPSCRSADRFHVFTLHIRQYQYLLELMRNRRFRSQFSQYLSASDRLPAAFSCPQGYQASIDMAFWEVVALRLYKYTILYEAMAWFSTLGGGFSCLGEKSFGAAEIAGKISLIQFRLATEMHSAVIMAKARLWFAQSLMQQGHLSQSANILKSIHRHWKPLMHSDTPAEERIDLMALGLWERLRYLWHQRLRWKRMLTGSSHEMTKGTEHSTNYRFPDLSVLFNSIYGTKY
ncbi:unnamed protein product [Calicophoron daubneyi]|uniref:Uncharacterized protein n=1 Tax=Calicophoron daubneyi TaxID=300641 RepID=A0AAV2T0L7_CALDB